MAVDGVFDLHMLEAASGSAGAALSAIAKDGNDIDNITDRALDQFRARYDGNAPSPHPEEARRAVSRIQARPTARMFPRPFETQPPQGDGRSSA
jgi:hypothetical protein